MPRPMMADLYRLYHQESTRHLDSGWIWKVGVHLRVSLFLWKVAWRCLLTRSFLREGGLDIQLEYLCCARKEEILVRSLF